MLKDPPSRCGTGPLRHADGVRSAGGSPRREPAASVAAIHDAAERAGDAGYLDPETGLYVLTAAYLRARGSCCESGCRHCPYQEAP